MPIRCRSARYINTVGMSTGSRMWLAPVIKMTTTQNLWHIKIRNRCMTRGLNQYPMVTNVHYDSEPSELITKVEVSPHFLNAPSSKP